MKVIQNETPATQETQEVVNIDTILMREVGQFGPYQKRVLAVAVVASMIAAFAANEYLFTTARIRTRWLNATSRLVKQCFLNTW